MNFSRPCVRHVGHARVSDDNASSYNVRALAMTTCPRIMWRESFSVDFLDINCELYECSFEQLTLYELYECSSGSNFEKLILCEL